MVRLSLYEISQQILLRISPLNYNFSEIRNSNSFQYILLFNLLGKIGGKNESTFKITK